MLCCHININNPRKKTVYMEERRCPGMGKEQRQSPGPFPSPGQPLHRGDQLGTSTVKFQTLCLAESPQSHLTKPPPSISGGCQQGSSWSLQHQGGKWGTGQRGDAGSQEQLPQAPGSHLTEHPIPLPGTPGAAQPKPRSPTAPGDPRVETSSPRTFPGLGSKKNKINLFPAG